MLTHDTEERQLGQYNVADVDAETWKILLEFMYSSSVRKIGRILEKVLATANKYGLPDLVKACEEHLVKTISLENAGELIMLVKQHSSLNLGELVSIFVTKNLLSLEELMRHW